MYETATNASPRPPSRIESDIETVKTLSNRVNQLTGHVVMIARSLGYFEPPKAEAGKSPSEVISNMSDAIRDLQRAVDNLDGSMNLFN